MEFECMVPCTNSTEECNPIIFILSFYLKMLSHPEFSFAVMSRMQFVIKVIMKIEMFVLQTVRTILIFAWTQAVYKRTRKVTPCLYKLLMLYLYVIVETTDDEDDDIHT